MENQVITYKWIPAHGYGKGRGSWKIRSIILHSADGHEAGDIQTLTCGRVSSHWYVTRDGRVFHFVNNDDTAWHAGVVNNVKFCNAASIGIEQEHIDGEQDWPPVQVEMTARICAAIMQKYKISAQDIHSHADVAYPAGRKVDPQEYPWELFFEYLKNFSSVKCFFMGV